MIDLGGTDRFDGARMVMAVIIVVVIVVNNGITDPFLHVFLFVRGPFRTRFHPIGTKISTKGIDRVKRVVIVNRCATTSTLGRKWSVGNHRNIQGKTTVPVVLGGSTRGESIVRTCQQRPHRVKCRYYY